jgi:hypothetical protein
MKKALITGVTERNARGQALYFVCAYCRCVGKQLGFDFLKFHCSSSSIFSTVNAGASLALCMSLFLNYGYFIHI